MAAATSFEENAGDHPAWQVWDSPGLGEDDELTDAVAVPIGKDDGVEVCAPPTRLQHARTDTLGATSCEALGTLNMFPGGRDTRVRQAPRAALGVAGFGHDYPGQSDPRPKTRRIYALSRHDLDGRFDTMAGTSAMQYYWIDANMGFD
ncbi:hypothetical protein CSUB01_11486 [Colletotrichum sublineola]|uniref:Uncharacterized protein n=1 Tax=Colletotrichum sublineola TaxID=1173701 RepID=A0A066X1V0_COLSU|nr:hypothetical protein CSUB01_11486 [Colletotrichum sublineola]